MPTLVVESTVQQVHDACRVILSDRAKYSTSLNYAVAYVREALNLTGNDLRVQCLYILNNLASWRHPQAKEVRSILKSYKGN